jgi:hypothetical protein
MFHYSRATGDHTNSKLHLMTVRENCAADCCCALFPNRFREEHFNLVQVMLDCVAVNAAEPAEPHGS